MCLSEKNSVIKKVYILFFLFFLLIVLNFADLAAGDYYPVKIDKTEIYVGDTFQLKIITSGVAEPVLSREIGDFELLTFKQAAINNNQQEFSLVFSIYKTGYYNAPEIRFKDKHSAGSDVFFFSDTSLIIQVKSVLNDSGMRPDGSVFDYNKPVLPDYDYSGIKIIAAAALTLAAGSLMFLYLYKRTKKHLRANIKIETVDLEPYNKLKAGLIKLRKMKISSTEASVKFSFELSFLIREYLSGVYKINCIESSNYELNEKLKDIVFYGKEDLLDILCELEILKFSGRVLNESAADKFIKITERVMNDFYAEQKD